MTNDERKHMACLQEQLNNMFDLIERKTPCDNIEDARIFLKQHPEARSKPDYWYR